MGAIESVRSQLGRGLVIPACPLALNAARRFDDRRQRTLLRYYRAAGAGGVAVGVHTTQFAIRRPEFGLLRPVLELAAGELRGSGLIGIAGVCGATPQAEAEAALARDLGYEAGLLSLAALPDANEDDLIRHCRAVAAVFPIIGFYLQPAAGGRRLSYSFWRKFAEVDQVVAIKIAPFNRYQTLDVARAVMEAGREDIALYTGNDDHILLDLLTPFSFQVGDRVVERRIVGGILGHWAVWVRSAVTLHARCRQVAEKNAPVPADLLRLAHEVTDANAAFFDAANGFAGCIAGVHEVLRRQGLFEGRWCLDPTESLGPGQEAEIDRVLAAYPHLADDAFVAANLAAWLEE